MCTEDKLAILYPVLIVIQRIL